MDNMLFLHSLFPVSENCGQDPPFPYKMNITQIELESHWLPISYLVPEVDCTNKRVVGRFSYEPKCEEKVLTSSQQRILIERGGVGAKSLRLTLSSNPTAGLPEAVDGFSLTNPGSLLLVSDERFWFRVFARSTLELGSRNADDKRMSLSSDKAAAICFRAISNPRPCGFSM